MPAQTRIAAVTVTSVTGCSCDSGGGVGTLGSCGKLSFFLCGCVGHVCAMNEWWVRNQVSSSAAVALSSNMDRFQRAERIAYETYANSRLNVYEPCNEGIATYRAIRKKHQLKMLRCFFTVLVKHSDIIRAFEVLGL